MHVAHIIIVYSIHAQTMTSTVMIRTSTMGGSSSGDAGQKITVRSARCLCSPDEYGIEEAVCSHGESALLPAAQLRVMVARVQLVPHGAAAGIGRRHAHSVNSHTRLVQTDNHQKYRGTCTGGSHSRASSSQAVSSTCL
jgi:hypothetical protein